ncbi:RICIN domain-containing protein [Streptomyces roseirectus]|uniref:RICIN domain-containing protein n=1 Tax=Streptomyces roseirectus TaxID=2768066 RepID=A0A7H0I9E4_9ACTN|nr:RICIN domain-containing protein [Streptomyces roseirectus]
MPRMYRGRNLLVRVLTLLGLPAATAHVLESAGADPLSASSSSGGCGNGRTTRAQKFTWNADGTPDFGTPVATGPTLPGPSGESANTPTACTLVDRDSGKCLDVSGGSNADGANVRQWTWLNNTCRQWRLVPAA